MNVRLLSRSGNAAIVSWLDDKGIPQAAVISNHHTLGTRVGEQFDLPVDVVFSGTEYGIDWVIVFPDDIITIAELQKHMRNHGIWTDRDLLHNTRETLAAINDLSAAVYMKMIEYAKRSLGE